MEEGDEEFTELREKYIRDALGRLEGIAHTIDVLELEPEEPAALQELRRYFNEVSRSARTYGFPQVTIMGLQGEYDCDLMIRESQFPRSLDLDRWRSLLQGLRLEFARTNQPEENQSSRKAAEILVVDDDKSSLEMLSELLQKQDIRVRCVQTREEAIAALNERMVDGVITDILLPDGLGYELVEYIRGLPDGDRLVILIVSVLSGFVDKVEAIRSGADGYFEKPVDWESLMERLQLLLARNKTEQVRILCVEDDAGQALYIETILGMAGYQVRLCDEPEKFEEDLASFRPDLVLIDYHFPRFSSYEVARYLRQDDRYAFMPVVLMTEKGEQPRQLDHLQASGDGYLVKPVAPGLLLTIVASQIERARFLRSHLNRDGLTRLLTLTAFVEQAKVMITKKRRKPDHPAAMVMIDLDDFRIVNQNHGHPIGDRVLIALSSFLRRRIRQSDIKSRYGGEEFAIIIDDIREDEATRLLTRLLDEFAAVDHHAADGSAFRVTFSAGVAMLDPKTMDFESWIQSSKNALQTAKDAGRRCVVAASSVPAK